MNEAKKVFSQGMSDGDQIYSDSFPLRSGVISTPSVSFVDLMRFLHFLKVVNIKLQSIKSSQ